MTDRIKSHHHEPTPPHPINTHSSFPHAFDLAAAGPGVLQWMLDDCARVRSAKAQGQDGEYSEGVCA